MVCDERSHFCFVRISVDAGRYWKVIIVLELIINPAEIDCQTSPCNDISRFMTSHCTEKLLKMLLQSTFEVAFQMVCIQAGLQG